MRRRAEAVRAASGMAAALLLAACAGTPERAPSPVQQQARSAAEQATRALQRGDLAQARLLYGSALTAAQALQDPALIGAARLNLALVESRRGDLVAAQAQLDALLDAATPADAGLQARAEARQAMLLLDAGDPAAALSWIERARSHCAAPCGLAPVLDNLQAHLALQRGDASAALLLARRAADQAAAADQPAERASALRLAGRAASAMGDAAQAGEALALALQIDRELGQPDRVALDLLYAAENEDRRGQPALATALYRRALAVYDAIGDRRNAAVLRARLDGR
jgi:hypothetical protein